jgi:peptidoglycan biosynthesis protein MviN/MurJ (putative lipid II flippase)
MFTILAPAVIASGCKKGMIRFALGSMLVHVLLSRLLRAHLGMVGIGLGYSFTGMLFFSYQTALLRRRWSKGFVPLLLARTLTPVAVCVMGVFLALLVYRELIASWGMFAAASASTSIYALGYLALMWVLRPKLGLASPFSAGKDAAGATAAPLADCGSRSL